MRINVLFKFNHEEALAAATGIEGDVTDILLPSVGDTVEHTDSGSPFQGVVSNRIFRYEIPTGEDIDGSVTVLLCLDRTIVN